MCLCDQVEGQPLLPKLASVIEAKAGTRLSLMHIELGAERVHNANKRQSSKPPDVATPPPTRQRSRTVGSGREKMRRHTPTTRVKSKSKVRKPNDKVLHEKQETSVATSVATKHAHKAKPKRRPAPERSGTPKKKPSV